MAIANPFVGFELKCNGKILINAPAVGEIDLYTAEKFAPPLCSVKIFGRFLVGKFQDIVYRHTWIDRQTRNDNVIKTSSVSFINGRDVTDPLVTAPL